MSDSFQQLQDELNKLNAAYREKVPEKIAALEEAWAETRREPKKGEALENFHLKAHSLAGSGATYGLPELSVAARKLEQVLKSLMQNKLNCIEEKKDEIQLLFDDLKQVAREIANNPAAPVIMPPFDPSPAPPAPAQQPTAEVSAPRRRATDFLEFAAEPTRLLETGKRLSRETDRRLIWLIETEGSSRGSAGYQLNYFGYELRPFQSLTTIPEPAFKQLPAAVIFDLTDPQKQLNTPAELAQLDRFNEAGVPLIFISALTDLETRLDAVRKGGKAYLIKPFKTLELVDTLDSFTSPANPDPYQILIVDDDENAADYYAAILGNAGMQTRTVNQPTEALQVLAEQNFDLVVMDFHMPGCNGPELAAVIRQQQAYVSIPIVFLSGETDRNQQLAAIDQGGGDDFLTKPIAPYHLKSAITSRAHRSRILRDFMVRDSLTGLLNHTTTKARLDAEVARAKRTGEPLAFAMVDIDHFKRVNDTFGHLAGDGVIKSISRLLRQRLRRTDSIGRYGGEEFAVILPGTNAQNAERILNEIRERFSHIQHQSDKSEFSATFSCGVAAFPKYRDAIDLNAAADQALYQAKNGGRNRVVIAGSSF